MKIQNLLDWHKSFSGSISKLSKDLVIFENLTIEEVIRDCNNERIIFFQTRSRIKSYKKTYYYACPNKGCNNVALDCTLSNKTSKCKKCEIYQIPKRSVKLEITVGKHQCINCIAFGEVAENLEEHAKNQSLLYLRIKRSFQSYKVCK